MTSQFGSELFPHIRVVMGIVLGLAMSKLLTGFAGLVQHPGRYRLSAVHLLWAGSILVELILFWWWEFALSQLQVWTFGTFMFLIGYTVTLYLMAALLFPDSIDEYGGYEAYFIRRRYWFFGLLAATFVFDVVDTMIKGDAHWSRLSTDYLLQVPFGLVLCAVACATRRPRVQLALALVHISYQTYWMTRILATT
ncbi:hypothetical protein [Dokdonella sp.]|uniref:hypothetical protein n=1 Tax=Dokdonella sp. TaxID=2291710 RepID=UPI0026210101|nr:hypothetical protein [Dokdonella sp.]